MSFIPPRSGTMSDVETVFNPGHQKAAIATGGQSSVETIFSAANDEPLITLPQLVLDGVSTIDNHDSNPVTSESQIIGSNFDGVFPFIVNNTGGLSEVPRPNTIQIISGVVTVSTVIDLGNIDQNKTHCFVGVQFFADAAGLIPTTPGVGTVTITIETFNSTPLFEAISDNVIVVDELVTKSWSANTISVKATPSGITIATHYRIVVTCNER